MRPYTYFSAVKRLMREACELREATEDFCARPLDDNLFEWHFTVQGPSGTDFDGGLYHGRILLPTEYPMKPPNIILLTPNGRFEINKKICLSISGHHPETWQPSWSIRTALLALIAFMPTPGNGTIGSLDYSPEERKLLAHKSQSWVCPGCGRMSEQLNLTGATNVTQAESALIKNVVFKGEEPSRESLNVGDKTDLDENNGESNELTTPLYEGDTEMICDGQDHRLNEAGVVSSNDVPSQCFKDTFFNFLIGFIVAAIAFLIYRRIFLL
ncbi:ubiquitin-conjugating enzyme E2 J1-like isoform X2 [Lycorma delicatula]|uniref:ubiquitin-conjugating enzyme E2 J1-like isoform X2 n=1 Tax=Lycorma delicatula TaxID=130591 RepID=UPI003F50F837